MPDSKDSHTRSIVKAASWRIFASSATFAIVYCFTGELMLSAGIGIVEVVSKLLLYYFHERLWNLSKFVQDARIANRLQQEDIMVKQNTTMSGERT